MLDAVTSVYSHTAALTRKIQIGSENKKGKEKNAREQQDTKS